jgi:hypothetical protein
MPELDAASVEQVPEESTWSYRLARRYVLDSRERGIEDGPAIADEAPAVGDATVRDTLSMQVDQLFSTAAPIGSDRRHEAETRGSETRLRVASVIGDRGSIDLRGFTESFDSAMQVDEIQQTASRDAAAMTVNFSYDTSTAGQLDVNAFYSQRDLEYSSLPPELGMPQSPSKPVEQRHRHWGYDANWSTRVDSAGKFAVKMDYQNTTLLVPGVADAADLSSGAEAIYTQSVGASGLYESEPLDDHTVQVDIHAHVRDSTNAVPNVGAVALTPAYFALSGASVGVSARDRWAVAGPFSLVYGLGYRHAISTHESSLIVPSVGGACDVGGVSVSMLFSYHKIADWRARPGTTALLRAKPVDAVGYEAQVELPLAVGLRLAGGTRYSPVQFDYVGRSAAGFLDDPAPIYLTDGTAAVRESRVALIQQSQRTRTYLEYSEGLVEGTLAAMTPSNVPQAFLTAGELDYDTGRLGVRVMSSGTDLLLQYQQLSQAPVERAGVVDSRQASFEFRLTQQLFTLRSVGDWRFLMAVRRASLDAEEDEEVLATSQLIDSMNHRVSAGLSLLF